MPRFPYRWLALLAALTAAVACGPSHRDYFGSTAPHHGPDEVWTNLGTEPEWIDPGKNSDAAGGAIIINLFAGIVQPHPVTLQPMPEIAEGWDIYEGGRRYVFHLRESVWSDGHPLTAHDFEWSWKRVLDPKTASKYSMFLYGVRHAEPFAARALRVRTSDGKQPDRARIEAAAGAVAKIDRVLEAEDLHALFLEPAATDDAAATRQQLIAALDGQPTAGGAHLQVDVADSSVVGIHALDDRTLEVQLENPLPYFLNLLAYHVLTPVPRHVIERLRAQGLEEDLWTRPEHIVSNGPYVLESWRFRQSAVLVKNPRYWDAPHVRVSRVKLAMVESYNTTLNLYEAGELDTIGESSLPNEFMDHLRQFKDFRSEPYLALYFLYLNTKVPPLDDARVRKALSLAVDRERLVKFVLRGGQLPSADLVPPGVAGYPGLHSPIFDPERARALLKQAGYGPAHPLPPIAYSYNTSEAHKQIAVALQQMWKDNLGVDVELRNQEWKVYLKSMETHAFQIARLGWIGDYPDPFTFLQLMVTGDGNNHSQYSNPRYDELLRQANTMQDRARRLETLEQAEALAMADAPIIPLYVYTRSEMVKPYLRGNPMNYQNRQLFKYWWIDRRFYDGVARTRTPELPVPTIPAVVHIHEEAAP